MLYGLHTLVYYIPPDPDLRFKCQSDKILIPISKNPYLMDEDSSPNPRIESIAVLLNWNIAVCSY